MQMVLRSNPEVFDVGSKWVRAWPKDVAMAAAAFAAVVILQDVRDITDVFHHVYWQDWSDQSKYVASARAFAEGALDPRLHWYPLLYPLALGAFMWLLPLFTAAAAVNLICFVLTYLGFRQIAARFGLSPLWTLALFLATTLLGSKLTMAWVVPWTTTLSSALIWLALARACRACDPSAPAPSAPQLALTGSLLGLIPLCRPTDIVVSASLGLFVSAWAARSPDRFRKLAALAGGGLSVIAAYASLHLTVYGPAITDYMKLSAAFGFDFAHLGWKAQTLLVGAGPFFPQGAGMMEQFPWLALGAAGLLAAVFRPDRRWLALLLGLPALGYVVLMLAYSDLAASNFWSFRFMHYFKWLMPLMALFAYDFVWSFPMRKAASLASLAAILAVTSLHYDAVAASPGEPAKLLIFAAPVAERTRLMMARSIVSDREGRLRNLFDYHQATDGAKLLYAEAWRRDFAGEERWSDSPPDAVWPVMAPRDQPTPLGETDRTPLARYRAQWAVGAPCWIVRSFCARVLPEASALSEAAMP
jgi:hypothetical protein